MAVALLRAAGITGFVVNFCTTLSSGRRVEFDIAFKDRRVAIELDGYAYHSGPDEHRADRRRANEIMADGWTVRRFTYPTCSTDPDGFIADRPRSSGRLTTWCGGRGQNLLSGRR